MQRILTIIGARLWFIKASVGFWAVQASENIEENQGHAGQRMTHRDDKKGSRAGRLNGVTQ